MKRANKIEKEVVKRIYANGGHWVELEMKSGDKLYIQRGNFETFEKLDKEKFNVDRNGVKILSKASLEDLARHIDENY